MEVFRDVPYVILIADDYCVIRHTFVSFYRKSWLKYIYVYS